MPLYDYRCFGCGVSQAVFKRIAQLDERELCARCAEPMQRLISAPTVRGDYPGYECPITGAWIEGRRAHEENLKRHGCRVLETGEREEVDRRRAQSDAELERAMGETFEAEIARLPARKRDQLGAEMDAGLTAEIVRQTA